MIFIDSERVEEAADYNSWVDTIESSLKLQRDSDYTMPRRSHIDFEENTLLLMPCIGPKYFATKLVSVFPGNTQKGEAPIYGTVVLNSSETGKPLAVIDGTTLTALRTAAVGSFGIRHLAPEEANILGVVGLGKQGLYQSIFACSQRNFRKIIIYDKKTSNIEGFKKAISVKVPEIDIIVAKSTEELCEQSEVVITATNSSEPVLPENENILRGKTVIGIGSYKPDMREFPDALFNLAGEIFIDTEDGLSESGDLIHPLNSGFFRREQLITASDMLKNKIMPVTDTRIFKSVGMALFDLYSAILVYESLSKD